MTEEKKPAFATYEDRRIWTKVVMSCLRYSQGGVCAVQAADAVLVAFQERHPVDADAGFVRRRFRRRMNGPVNPVPVAVPAQAFVPTVQQFEEAQREVEVYQSQLDQLQAAADSMPGGISDYMRAAGRAMVEGSLLRATQYRDRLQALMEAAVKPGAEGGQS